MTHLPASRPLPCVRGFWLLLIMGLLVAPSASRAGTISIGFDLGGSSVSLPNGIEVPPAGEALPGSLLVLHLEGDVAPDEMSGTVLPGTGVLDGLVVVADIDARPPLEALFTGNLSIVQFGAAIGSLAGDLATLTLVDPVVVEFILFVDCVGVDCELFGTFPLDIETFSLIPGQTLTLSDVNTPGGASLAGLFDIDLGGESVTVDLQGVESSRAYVVPEPSSGLLLLVGLVLLRGRRLRRPTASGSPVRSQYSS